MSAPHVLALYHEDDIKLFKRFKIFLAPLRNTKKIDVSRLDLPPGLDSASQEQWVDEVDVVVVFLTAIFVSDFDQLPAVMRAIERWKERKVTLIPVLVQRISLAGTPFDSVRCVPRNGTPLALWKNEDEAWNDVVEGLTQALLNPIHSRPMRTSGEAPLPARSLSNESAAKPDRLFRSGFGLFIGVGGDLKSTVQDATALANLFSDPWRAAYPKNQVTLLTEENAGRDRVLSALDRLIADAEDVAGGATVIFYYSGHGARIRQGDKVSYYLVPDGYDPSRLEETAISGQELGTRLAKLRRHKLLVLLDCCHAAAIPDAKSRGTVVSKSAIPGDLIERLDAGTGQIIIASSMDHEISLTGEPHSVFTSCLLEALSGQGARHEEGYATLFDVATYLLGNVSHRARGIQHPVIRKMENVTEDFAICAYPGGDSRSSGGSGPSIPKAAPQPAASTSFEQQRREKELRAYIKEWELITGKIAVLRLERAASSSAAVKFEMEYQLKQMEEMLVDLEQRLARFREKP